MPAPGEPVGMQFAPPPRVHASASPAAAQAMQAAAPMVQQDFPTEQPVMQQFAPTAAVALQKPMRTMGAVTVQPTAGVPMQFAVPQYRPEQLQAAQKKRRSWYMLNAAMIAVQTLVLALGIFCDDNGYDIGVPMVLGWLLSQPICGFISGMLRPDEAYLEKKPVFRSRVLQAFMHTVMSLPASAAMGGILFAILQEFFF